jgi:mono/diheme cytochrome c family protein
MPAYAEKLSDQEIADVATYIRNSWGNAASAVTAAQVAKARDD